MFLILNGHFRLPKSDTIDDQKAAERLDGETDYMRGKDISGFKVSQESGTDGKLTRRWESEIECLRRRGASWGQENKWETVIGKSESQWEQINGKRL